MNMHYSQFNALDLLIVGMIVFSILVSCSRGFISEILGFSSWIGAVYLAMTYCQWPRNFWSQWISDPTILTIVCYVTVGLLSLLIFLTLSQFISQFIKNSVFGPVDRSLGCVFGIVRGCTMVLGIYLVSLFFLLPSSHPSIFKTSKSRPILDRSVLWVTRFIPHNIQEKGLFLRSLEEIDPQTHQNNPS